MEVLQLDGKKYVKASSIARELGYTADYVGQLCRAGKVDAHLVGRSWYVREDSIREHKESRYRSSRNKTHEAFKVELQKEQESSSNKAQNPDRKVATRTHHFYSKITPKSVKYNEDSTELIPILKERRSSTHAEIDVEPAGAQEVPIKKESAPYRLEATERPQIRFTGRLDIEPAEGNAHSSDTGQAAKEGRSATERAEKQGVAENSPAKVRIRKGPARKQTRKRMPISDMGDVRTSDMSVRTGGVVALSRQGQAALGEVQELEIQRVRTTSKPSGRATFAYLSISLLVAAVLAFGSLFLEESVVATSEGSGTATQYGINITAAMEAFDRLK